MRRRFSRRRSFRRTVAWIDGLSGFDTTVPAQSRVLVFAALAGAPNTYAAAIALTQDSDLSMHGGEDAVIERIRGRLLIYNSRSTPAGPVAAAFFFRVLITQQDASVAGAVAPLDFTTSVGLGRDDILWSHDCMSSPTSVLGNGTAVATETGTLNSYWFDVDVKARRKLQAGHHIFIQFQTTSPGGGVVPHDFRIAGGLRMLMKRPR